jgi:hypothetical protein
LPRLASASPAARVCRPARGLCVQHVQELRGGRSRERHQRVRGRSALGVFPVQRLNARWNDDGSEKPISWAVCLIESRRSSSKHLAVAAATECAVALYDRPDRVRCRWRERSLSDSATCAIVTRWGAGCCRKNSETCCPSCLKTPPRDCSVIPGGCARQSSAPKCAPRAFRNAASA